MLALLFRTIEAFKLFDVVFLLTEGGPGTSTETIAIYVYRQAIQFNKTSDSTAISYILLFTVIVLTNLYLYLVNRRAQGGLVMTDAAAADAAVRRRPACRAASARPAGAARSAPAIVSLIYFFPVLWIILTAFKSYNDALAVPPKFLFTPTLENFVQVFSRAYSAGAAAQSTPTSTSSSSTRSSSPAPASFARAGHRHARRLRLLALPAQGQRHLSLHHPHHAHAAGDRGDHPDHPDVPGHRARRHLSRHHPALHRLQPALHDLDDEELLRRAVARRRGRRAPRRLVRHAGCSSRSACRRCSPASPRPRCSA